MQVIMKIRLVSSSGRYVDPTRVSDTQLIQFYLFVCTFEDVSITLRLSGDKERMYPKARTSLLE